MSILASIFGVPQPFEEGQLARQMGYSKKTNPYSGDDYDKWSRGWDLADDSIRLYPKEQP